MNIINRFKTRCFGKRTARIAWIVVHYTGTAAGALANARALERPLKDKRSTHYFVDGSDIIHTVDDVNAAWHIGGMDALKKMPVCNTNSVGVDLCERKKNTENRSAQDRDWYFSEETEATAAQLVAQLCFRHSVKINHVVRHFDVTGKLCPRPFCCEDINTVYGESGNARWLKFKARVARELAALYDGEK